MENNKIPADKNISETQNIETYIENGFRTIVNGVRCSNNITPLFTNIPENSTFNKIMTSQSNRLLNLMTTILNNQRIYENITQRDLEEKFELLIQANDTILDRVDANLDEIAGIRWNPPPSYDNTSYKNQNINGSWNKNNLITVESNSKESPVRLLTAVNIQRPQIKFKDKIDNTNLPFCPKLKDKPNNLKPLAVYLETTDDGIEYYCHPYEYELDRFSPNDDQLKKADPPRTYKSLDETPLEMITEPEQIKPLVDELLKYQEISVDLEHHSYRTYQGITCLMQISTVDKDYIIDTLTLRNSLQLLNEVFTKPSIIKVLHGAYLDILWLQRDLGLYIVGLFDTYHAAKALGLSRLSLAFLLKHYCKLDPNKHFQLADWRIRPLPEELILYAREDTHYLLHIYDIMKNELLELGNGQTNILESVFQKSTIICAKRYDKPVLEQSTHLDFYHKNKRLFNNRQLSALRDIFNWRDKIARIEDESTGYVLPNHMMLQIAETLPREVQGILACCNPIPPLLRQNVMTIHQMILVARDQPLVKQIVNDEGSNHLRPILASSSILDIENPLYCPHDLSHAEEGIRDDLPTVLTGLTLEEFSPKQLTRKSVPSKINLFNNNSKDISSNDKTTNPRVKFISPYMRYELTRKDAEEEAKQQATLDKEKHKNELEEQEEKERANDQRLVEHIKLKEEKETYYKQKNITNPQNKKRKSQDGQEIIPSKLIKVENDPLINQIHPEKNLFQTPKTNKKKKNKNKNKTVQIKEFKPERNPSNLEGTSQLSNKQMKRRARKEHFLQKKQKLSQELETNPNSIPKTDFSNERFTHEEERQFTNKEFQTKSNKRSHSVNSQITHTQINSKKNSPHIGNIPSKKPYNYNFLNSPNQNNSHESNEEYISKPFQPFDYSQVDYANYKGGSHMTPKSHSAPKERFRKGKKKFFGSGNKGSSTFGLK